MKCNELEWQPQGLLGPIVFEPVSIRMIGTAISEDDMLSHIGRCAGIAYSGAWSLSDRDKAIKRALNCIRNGHHSVLEHVHFTTESMVDRGTSHAIVRHRHIAVTQSSTIYHGYKSLIPCISRPDVDPITGKEVMQLSDEDIHALKVTALEYLDGVNKGNIPSVERDLLPTMLAASVVITTHIGQYVYMSRRRRGAGDSFRMHVWAMMLDELLREHYPRAMAAFDEYYEKRPLD